MPTKDLVKKKIIECRDLIIKAELTRKERISLNDELRLVISANKTLPVPTPEPPTCKFSNCSEKLHHNGRNRQGRCRDHQTVTCGRCQRVVPQRALPYSSASEECTTCMIVEYYWGSHGVSLQTPRLKIDRANFATVFFDQMSEELKVKAREIENAPGDIRHKAYDFIRETFPCPWR